MADTTETEARSEPSTNTTVSAIKALQEIVKRQLSGRLTLYDPNANSILWRVYLGNGLVHFATSVNGQQERLSYLLQQYHPELEFLQSTDFQSDYQYLCNLWQSGKLSLQKFRQLLFSLTQEAILQLLTLPQVQLGFEKTVGLDPLVLSVPLKQAVVPIQQSINQWVQLQPEISSPFQRPVVTDLKQFSEYLQIHIDNPQKIELLSQKLTQNLCLYEAAYQLKMDALELAKFLHPIVRSGVVGMIPYRTAQNDDRPTIACIDDSKTVQRNVKLILEASGYRVLELMEPARALTTLARQKPVLILMDISMPEIDGYELCRLLRRSNALQEIPIVMLTGRDGLIDRLRARMVGANDYMTKPFNPQELIDIVQKLTNQSQTEVS